MASIWIVWPQQQWLGEEEVRIRYTDAVTNGEMDSNTTEDPGEMALALHDAGIIALGQASKWDQSSADDARYHSAKEDGDIY